MKQKNHKKSYKKSLSRLMAIQIFYQYEFLKREKNLEELKRDLINEYALSCEENLKSYADKIDDEFLSKLLNYLNFDCEKIDFEIENLCKRNFENDLLLQQILRLGAVEIKYFDAIPTNVIINEYVDIAASFFEPKQLGFINANLDAISKLIRKNNDQNDQENSIR